jgi:hypothetical protein
LDSSTSLPALDESLEVIAHRCQVLDLILKTQDLVLQAIFDIVAMADARSSALKQLMNLL